MIHLGKRITSRGYTGDALHYTEFDRNHRFVWATRGIDAIGNIPDAEWQYEAVTGMLYFLFPNIQLTGGSQSCSLIKIYPDGDNPGKSITRVHHYFSQEMIDHSKNAETVLGRENAYSMEARQGDVGASLEATMEIFDSTIEKEDYLMGETTQKSAESGLLDYVMFGRNEPALHHYHNNYRAALGMEPLERLDQQQN